MLFSTLRIVLAAIVFAASAHCDSLPNPFTTALTSCTTYYGPSSKSPVPTTVASTTFSTTITSTVSTASTYTFFFGIPSTTTSIETVSLTTFAAAKAPTTTAVVSSTVTGKNTAATRTVTPTASTTTRTGTKGTASTITITAGVTTATTTVTTASTTVPTTPGFYPVDATGPRRRKRTLPHASVLKPRANFPTSASCSRTTVIVSETTRTVYTRTAIAYDNPTVTATATVSQYAITVTTTPAGVTVTSTTTITSTPPPSTVTAAPSTVTVTVPLIPTVTVQQTVTTTSTVAVATYYAACSPDNILTVDSAITGQTNVGGELYPKTPNLGFLASAYDCCVACITTTNCAASIYLNSPDDQKFFCQGEIAADCTVDKTSYSYAGPSAAGDPNGQYTISNGLCGRYYYEPDANY